LQGGIVRHDAARTKTTVQCRGNFDIPCAIEGGAKKTVKEWRGSVIFRAGTAKGDEETREKTRARHVKEGGEWSFLLSSTGREERRDRQRGSKVTETVRREQISEHRQSLKKERAAR